MRLDMEWTGDKYLEDIQKTLGDNLEKAAIFLKGKIKEKLNQTGNPVIVSRGKLGPRYANENPSSSGNPPHKMTGYLQRSITYEMKDNRTVAQVGSPLKYGAYLELGTSNMAARPFLRQALDENKEAISRMIAGS